MVLLDNVLAVLQARHRAVNNFISGLPRLLIRDGRILEDELANERLRMDELFSQLREHQVKNTGEIHYAFLEPSGRLGIIRFAPEDRVDGQQTLPQCVLIGSKARPMPMGS
jgi:uncharacterized membrane protein YcaP (DUF421 family)